MIKGLERRICKLEIRYQSSEDQRAALLAQWKQLVPELDVDRLSETDSTFPFASHEDALIALGDGS